MQSEVAHLDARQRQVALAGEACVLAWHPRRPFIRVADASGRAAGYDVESA